MRSGVLEKAINSYKFDGYCSWALIFGRVLAGYLNANRKNFSKFDLIVSSPTFVFIGGRREWDHIRTILEKAAEQVESGEWPIDLGTPAVITQDADIPRFSELNSWKKRHEVAIGALRSVLTVPDPCKTRDRKILVFDDVFTEGLRMNEVARALKIQGRANMVSGVVLARQQFKGRRM